MLNAGTSRRPRGFTVIEILVVVGIIALLVAILIPAMSKMQKSAVHASAVTELHTIRTGLAAYYADFNVYPPSSPASSQLSAGKPIFAANSYNGPEMLAEGLMGYMAYGLDGAGVRVPTPAVPDPPFGFRVRPAGQIYGPYVTADPNIYAREQPGSNEYFIDPWGPRVAPKAPNGSPNPPLGAGLPHKIFYFRSSRSSGGTSVASATTIFGDSSSPNALFNYTDCSPFNPADASNERIVPTIPELNTSLKVSNSRIAFMRMMNPSASPAETDLNKLNQINGSVPGETSYLLISAGTDGRPVFGYPNTPETCPWTGYYYRENIIMTNDSSN